jgi:alkanesulfonate monooxygenase SsuD/methylene tetrahydromethanopterin reductase-like flavin-dependent oxidoreductase (luciferase family)
MRLSIWPSLQQPWSEVVEVVGHAESTGWDGAYVADHFMGDGSAFGAPETPTFEATAAIAALASATERLRLGSLVLGGTYRHPAVVAKWAATVDHVSGGRLVLGIGAGWQQNEHDQYGIELPPPGPRVDRFVETCQAITGLLRQTTTDLDGDHVRLSGALAEPKPVQDRLPLLVGGKGDRMLGVTARYADEWNMWGLPGAIAERAAVLDQRCEAIDRDPAEIARSCQALVFVTDDRATAASLVERVAPRAAVGGPPDAFGEVVTGWAAVGVDEVIVPDFTLGRGAQRTERMDALLQAARSAA